MLKHRLLGGVATFAIALAGLAALPGSADATVSTTHVIVTPPENLLDLSQSRSTGHSDFLENGLHVWTEGSGYTDKAAGYLPQDESLSDFVSYGEPSLTWTPTNPSLPQAPGEQIVVDFDGDGTPDGILVGEPAYYGTEWWLTNDSAQWVKDGAPHTGGGYGSDYYGTLAEWAAAFTNAATTNVGYSLGSGVHGDGVISAMTFGNTTYTFALGVGPCEAYDDVTTQTYTLSQDCSTYETINVDDGWTVDGAGYTITAKEDATHQNFPGPIMLSATGDDTAPATMNVKDLHITTQFSGTSSGGQLAGIKFMRAGGTVSDVSINGVTHGDGVQEGNALYIRNRADDGSANVPEATVNVDNVSITRYQKTGVIFDGNVDFTMTNSTVGSSTDEAGNPIPGMAANSVQISRSAHGTLSGNTIALNDYNPAQPPGDGSDATAILNYDAGTVNISQNQITGTNGDVAIDSYNDGSGSVSSVINIACNLISRSETQGDYDPYGVGVAQWNDGSTPVQVNLSDTTFSGWVYNTGLLDGAPPNLTVQPGATDQQLGQCLPTAPTDVSNSGGEQQTDVSWTASTAPDYAPISGYDITLTGDDSSTQTQHVSADTTTAHFDGLSEGVTYTASVVADNASGQSAPGTATAYSTSVTLSPTRSTVAYKKSTTVTGTLNSTDPNADLTGRTVQIQARPSGSADWTTIGEATTAADGSYSFAVTPTKNTAYRAHYAGAPDMSSTSGPSTVYVRLKVTLAVSDTTVTMGTTVMFSGHVGPNQAGQPVMLQRLVGKKWQTIDTGTLRKNSRYVFRWVADIQGSTLWRVTSPATDDYARGVSKRKQVTVS